MKVRFSLFLGFLSLTPLASANIVGDIKSSISSLWNQKARKQDAARDARNNAIQKKRQALLLHEQLEDTQKLLQRANQNYENYFEQMRRTEEQIVDTREEIQEVQVNYKKHRQRFSARLAAYQRHGQPGFLAMALSSKSLSDLTRRANIFTVISKHDVKLQNDLLEDRRQLKQRQNALMAQWAERDALQKKANKERVRIVNAERQRRIAWRKVRNSSLALLQYAAAQENSSREITGMIGSLESRKSQIIARYEAEEAERISQRNRRYNSNRSRRRKSREFRSNSGRSEIEYAPRIDVGPRYAPQIEMNSRSGGWQLPARGRMSSRFGMRFHPVLHRWKLHTGQDIAAPHGAPIRAAQNGVVLWAGWKTAYGNTVIMDVGGSMTLLYGHASRLCVRAGQRVSRGQILGNVGSTGFSTGPHLHFEVRKNGLPVNPMRYLR